MSLRQLLVRKNDAVLWTRLDENNIVYSYLVIDNFLLGFTRGAISFDNIRYYQTYRYEKKEDGELYLQNFGKFKDGRYKDIIFDYTEREWEAHKILYKSFGFYFCKRVNTPLLENRLLTFKEIGYNEF
jgi:hypothetical protein